MFLLKCLIWIAVESVGVSAFMNILRPGSGCGGVGPCQGPQPQIPFIPQQPPINCGQFPCPGGPQIPFQPPLVPAVQHGSHYSGQNPTPAPAVTPTPALQKCTQHGGGICALACNVTGFTEDASDRFTCGIHGDVCCIIPVG